VITAPPDLKRVRVFRLESDHLVVLDPVMQPEDKRFWVLYFVHGAALRVRERNYQDVHANLGRNDEDHAFAIEQYARWWTRSPADVAAAMRRTAWSAEPLPDLREPCPKCLGTAHVRYIVGSFADKGVYADGVNVVDTCDECHGEGYRYVLQR
jgi:hypothetical protein